MRLLIIIKSTVFISIWLDHATLTLCWRGGNLCATRQHK